MHSANSPKPSAQPLNGDYTGWLVEDARLALAGHQLILVETTPPRASGPLGDWRVLRCVFFEACQSKAARYELLIAQEQMPEDQT